MKVNIQLTRGTLLGSREGCHENQNSVPGHCDRRAAHEQYALGENAQQAKMKSCNAEPTVKGLKGADRQAFMKSCLSGK